MRVSARVDWRRFKAFSIFVVLWATAMSAEAALPEIWGKPPTSVALNGQYSFQPSSRDRDGQRLSFSVRNLPSWASLDTSTGRIYGRATRAGTYSGIRIVVTAGGEVASLKAFTITVSGSSSGSGAGSTSGAPTVTGTPATSVTVGSTYRFAPTARDPNGDTLGFSISNRPSWATFSTSTGVLSGQPTLGNVGTYSNIVIRVSDGRNTVRLPAFSINVAQSSSGAATLSWTPPTRNTNGSPLSNLAGYRIYYGTSSSSLNQQVQIANPGVSSYVISGLRAGTYYFGVRAYNGSGAESSLSNLAVKTVR